MYTMYVYLYNCTYTFVSRGRIIRINTVFYNIIYLQYYTLTRVARRSKKLFHENRAPRWSNVITIEYFSKNTIKNRQSKDILFYRKNYER